VIPERIGDAEPGGGTEDAAAGVGHRHLDERRVGRHIADAARALSHKPPPDFREKNIKAAPPGNGLNSGIPLPDLFVFWRLTYS